MTERKDFNDWEMQSIRIGMATQLGEKALMIIGRERGVAHLAELEEEFIAAAKNMDIEGVPPDQEALVYEEAIKIIRATFTHARERLAAE
jgi:hypothetical protein